MHWLPGVLRGAGLKVEETAGWVTRGKDTTISRMDPQCVIAHHTATGPTTPDRVVDRLLILGRSDLPGPLCQLGLRRDGTYVVIASGIANHAGSGGWRGVTGNKRAIGIEAYNDGRGETWPKVQLDAYERGVAAILNHLKLPAAQLCGHREWAPKRKIDPTGIDMGQMRLNVGALMILEDIMNQITQKEIDFLKAMIAGVLSINSNPDFARVLILDYRNRQST